MKRLGWRKTTLIAVLLASIAFNAYVFLPVLSPIFFPPSQIQDIPTDGLVVTYFEVYDGHGHLIARQPSHSYVRQFLQSLYTCFGDTTLAVNMVSGVGTATCSGDNTNVNAAAAEVDCGIVVGTGTTAEGVADAALNSQIAEGVGAGQLQHGAMTVNVPTTTGGQTKVSISRVFTNGSGGSVTVNEIAVYANRGASPITNCAIANTDAIMLLRDLVTFTVPNADTATVVYNILTNV